MKKLKNLFKNNLIIIILLLLIIIFFYDIDDQKIKNFIPVKVNRIVSLSPSITRQIIDLNSENLLVGVTSFHPPMKRQVKIVGTWTKPNIEQILLLKPDIVLASESDSAVQFTEILSALKINNYTFEKNDSFESITKNYLKLSEIINKKEFGQRKVNKYLKENNLIDQQVNKKFNVLLLISHHPIIGASNHSFIGKMIEETGAKNVLANLENAYPVIVFEYILKLNPDIVISILHSGFTDSIFTDEFFNNFKNLKISKNKSVYYLDPKYICYYTPFDYIKAKQQIYKILKKELTK